MDDVEEKRVFGDRAAGSELLVAAAVGLVAVEVSADRVGRFGVLLRCDPADVAGAGGLVAVATYDDVLVRGPGGEEFAETGFGSAAAVGVDDGTVTAVGPDGRVARLEPSGDGGWTALGEIGAEIRATDPPLLATADGVHRLPGLDYVGLDDAYDVAARGPFAATGGGLYSLGNGWMEEADGDFRVVATGGEWVHAATRGAFVERREDEWPEVDLPVDDSVVDVAYADVPYAVTADGVLLARGEDGWRANSLGVEGVVGCVMG